MPMSWDQRHIRKAEQKRLQQWGIAEGNCTMSFVPAHDGWQLAVSGYSSQPTKGLPVLLCHGMGANRLTFDLDADISLARYLAAQGYDVYTVDLRAHGKSEKPSWTGRRKWNWGFNDYVYQDLPAVIDFILAETGQKQLNFVGHSMGGHPVVLPGGAR
ncbi:MAG: alpha/beta hydrolase [Pseudomonadales bacterium]|uniref:AB hydrolase-1 domain-containing protein n=1 Tax=Oleiphilus messinensis TaxID=141451 RepID=A0A1Y0IE32_9GAMM|nr:alpha/beta fold hydrolase [Oleiphilus messinensis]ARU58429.1 hypothetical protein OLMES_4433 [Oleiphilus messinensis]MCG8611540.1 alpha/beta hydrolase [Pseudomonadales bacterium]